MTVKDERQKIIATLSGSHAHHSGLIGAAPHNVENTVVALTMEETRAALESKQNAAEYKRLEMVKKRQEKEVQRILENENQLQLVQKKIEAQEEKAEELKKERAVLKKKKEDEMLKKREKRQEEQHAKYLKQLEARQQMAEDDARREEAEIEKEKQDMKLREKRLREADEKRRAVVVERQRQMREMINAQERQAELNRVKMDEREDKLHKALALKKIQRREERERSQAEAKKRISAALDRQKKNQEENLKTFLDKQAAAATRAAERREVEEEKMAKRVVELADKKKVRKQRLEDAYAKDDDKRQGILDHRSAAEARFAIYKAERDQELAEKTMLEDIRKVQKQENVVRVRRVEDFNRLMVLQKIQEDDDRSDRLKAEREYLRAQVRVLILLEFLFAPVVNAPLLDLLVFVATSYLPLWDVHCHFSKSKVRMTVSFASSSCSMPWKWPGKPITSNISTRFCEYFTCWNLQTISYCSLKPTGPEETASGARTRTMKNRRRMVATPRLRSHNFLI